MSGKCQGLSVKAKEGHAMSGKLIFLRNCHGLTMQAMASPSLRGLMRIMILTRV